MEGRKMKDTLAECVANRNRQYQILLVAERAYFMSSGHDKEIKREIMFMAREKFNDMQKIVSDLRKRMDVQL